MNKVKEGYKISELGEIPNEWDIVKLKEVLDLLKDGTHNPPKRTETGIPLLSAENIFNGKVNYGLNEKYISLDDYYSMHKNYEIEHGDILMTIVGTIGRVAIVQYDEKFTVQRSVAILKNNKKINNKFLAQFLSSDICKKELDRKSNSTAQSGLYLGELAKINIILPTLKEQERIASILSTVEEQIDNVDELIQKNKELKKGLMQQLLTKGIGHTKFKKTEIGEIPEEWEVNLLEDVFEILDSMRKPIKASDRENMKGNIPYYGASGIIDWVNDYIFDEDLILLGEDGENLNSRNSDLAFKISGKSWINNHAHVFRINNKEKYNIDFMVYYLESKDYSMYISGSAQPKITQAQCRKFLLPIPKKKEQDKIAYILLENDKKIEEYEIKKQKLEELKKGLMQQLLTGKIRV